MAISFRIRPVSGELRAGCADTFRVPVIITQHFHCKFSGPRPGAYPYLNNSTPFSKACLKIIETHWRRETDRLSRAFYLYIHPNYIKSIFCIPSWVRVFFPVVRRQEIFQFVLIIYSWRLSVHDFLINFLIFIQIVTLNMKTFYEMFLNCFSVDKKCGKKPLGGVRVIHDSRN